MTALRSGGPVLVRTARLGRSWLRRAALAFAVALPPVVAAAAAPEVFSPEDLLAGRTLSRSECKAMPDAVWVEHSHGTECIRYFASKGVDGAPLAVFWFHGDRLDGRKVLAAYSDNSVPAQRALAARNAALNGVPWIGIARPGAYGSSGDHGARRQPKEFHTLNAAVEAIKLRYGISRVVLAGHGGGAAVVGALLTLGRTDVDCAITASGTYAIIERAERLRASSGSIPRGVDLTGFANPYEPIDRVDGIRPDRKRRLFIIGDPSDTNTYFDLQRKFAERVHASGHQVSLVETNNGLGTRHHDLTRVAFKAAGWCAAGFDTEEVVRRIQLDDAAINEVGASVRAGR